MNTSEDRVEETNVVYDPNGLLDAVAVILSTRNDAALSRALGVAPPVVSKLRRHRMPVGASFILKCHEIAGMPVATVRSFIGGAA